MKKLFIVTGTPLGEYVTNDWLNAVEVWNENRDRGAELLYGTAKERRPLDGIRVEGHVGTWYVIDVTDDFREGCDGRLFLLEHERYGDEAACLIVDDDFRLVLDDVWNGFDDLEEALEAEEEEDDEDYYDPYDTYDDPLTAERAAFAAQWNAGRNW